jgi:hypothetical protein
MKRDHYSCGIASSHGGIEIAKNRLVRIGLPVGLPRPSPVGGKDGAGGNDGGGGGGIVTQGTGRVLTNVHVRPIFWGTAWYHPSTPSVGDIMWAIRSIFLGPYMSGLAQYGVGVGWLDPNPIFTGLSVDPPNSFSETQLQDLLTALIDNTLPGAAGSLVDPALDDQLLPVVFTPRDVSSTNSDFNGFHNWMSYHGTKFPYAWVKNISELEFLSAVYSHELAEACTDPFDDGVVGAAGSCGQPGGCEIGDYCYGNESGRGSGFIGGVNVQAYWSIQDDGCYLPAEHHVSGQPTGNLALIQGRFLSRGNFELLLPQAGGGFAHYSRDNDEPRLWWYGPETFGEDVGAIDAVTMLQSNFTAGPGIGNLEAVVRWQGELLFFWREDLPPYRWHGPTLLSPVPGGNNIVAGSLSMIQSRFGFKGNFELVTPLASGGLAHYSRANDDPNLGWYGPAIFAESGGVFAGACLVQSNFSSSGSGPGNLEVVARAGSLLLHYWRDDAPPYTWHGPEALPLGGQIPIGIPSFIQDRFGDNGYFQVVTPTMSGGLAHYTRDNTPFGGQKWYGPTVFGDGYEGGPYDAVSLIQSNFSCGIYAPSSSGIGNLELVARSQNNLFHFWRANNTQIAGDGKRMWYGPWVVSN